MKVRLFTLDGKDVLDKAVTIPPFKMAPDVLFFGIRCFRIDHTRSTEDVAYTEAFAYSLDGVLSPINETFMIQTK